MPKNKSLRILSFFIFPVFVYLFALFLGEMFNAFNVYTWLDIPMHFLGGVSIAYTFVLFLRFFREKGLMEINNKIIFILVIISLVSFVAILWELYEFAQFYLFNMQTQPSVADTMFDLFMGLVGGVFGALVFRNK